MALGAFHTTIFIPLSFLPLPAGTAAGDQQCCHQEHQQSRWKNGRDEDACPHGDGEYSNDAVPSSPKHPAPPPFLTAQYMTAPLSPVPVFFRNRMRMHVLFHHSGDQMSVASMGALRSAAGRLAAAPEIRTDAVLNMVCASCHKNGCWRHKLFQKKCLGEGIGCPEKRNRRGSGSFCACC